MKNVNLVFALQLITYSANINTQVDSLSKIESF